MNIKEQLEVDIATFLEQIKTQHRNDQLITMRNLLNKYIHLSTSDYMMDGHDLRSIIGIAKSSFASNTFPVYLGAHKKVVNQVDLPNLCVIEATISHLKKKDCLKKIAKFDYKENKF